jgi:ribosome-interacting GTPase 1
MEAKRNWLIFYIYSIYIPCIYVLNKIDQISIEELDLIYKIPNAVPISSNHEWNFDELLEVMWQVSSC